jgi:hypothetical protein
VHHNVLYRFPGHPSQPISYRRRSLAYRARLEHFYSEHAPSKVKEVPSLVAKNAGQEDRLVKRLEKK